MPTHKRRQDAQLADALTAVEKGLLSVEKALRLALESKPGQDWFPIGHGKLLRAAHRGVTLRNLQRFSRPVATKAVEETRRELRGNDDVLSIHWGLRRRSGVLTRQACVVVYVTTKHPRDHLNSEDVIPSEVSFRHGQRNFNIPIDVQAVGRPGVLHVADEVTPGNRAAVGVPARQSFGTLSALVRVAGSLRAVLSGHVALNEGETVTGTAADGTVVSLGDVERVSMGLTGDFAWSGPVDSTDSSLLVGAPVSVRDPDEGDVPSGVSILTKREIQPLRGFISSVSVKGTFSTSVGSETIPGLVGVTPLITIPGDSGSPALDDNGVLIGFVVGAWNGQTCLMPARRVIDAITL